EQDVGDLYVERRGGIRSHGVSGPAPPLRVAASVTAVCRAAPDVSSRPAARILPSPVGLPMPARAAAVRRLSALGSRLSARASAGLLHPALRSRLPRGGVSGPSRGGGLAAVVLGIRGPPVPG